MTETNISTARVPQVTVIDPRIPEKTKLRVAAYARVSSDSEDQVNSYIAQVDFYSKYIAGKEEWEMVDIYADEGISGLEARNRDDFNRMMTDCREGKIDRVLCKSISRFARNTQEYIQFVRELLRLGISIHFEKENIDTGKMTSEQVAQIYGAFAQMESTNHSSNMRFSVRMRMEKGLFVPSSVPYGYRLAGRDLEIIPEEAEVVRRIFSAYLSGQGKDDIARELNQLGVDRGRNRGKWHPSTVAYILTNITYTGDMIWQKKLRHRYHSLPAGSKPRPEAPLLCRAQSPGYRKL
ncbi:MAG: recombinase family protein [Oscillospiraceae bacterium]